MGVGCSKFLFVSGGWGGDGCSRWVGSGLWQVGWGLVLVELVGKRLGSGRTRLGLRQFCQGLGAGLGAAGLTFQHRRKLE